MKVRKPRKLSAVVLSVVLALSMTVGVMPVTPAAANTGDNVEGVYTIYYDFNASDSLSATPQFAEDVAVENEVEINVGTITITAAALAGGNYATYNLPDASKVTRAHYTFNGWKDVENGDVAITQVTPAASQHSSIKATWEAKDYGVTYIYGEDGSAPAEVPATFTVDTLDTLAITPTVTTTGKVFDGWNTAADGTGTALSAINTSDALTTALGGGTSLTLYAQYKAATPNVTYVLANGDPYVPSSDAFKKYTYSENAQNFALPATQTTAETGYAMKWKIGSTVVASEGTYEIPAGSVADLEFTEFAEPISYTISYTDKDNDPVSPTSAKESWNVKDDTTMTLPAAKSSAPANKVFAGWTDGTNTYAAGATYTFDKDNPDNITFKETWAYEKYDIVFTGLDGMTDGDIQDELVIGGNTKVGDTVVKKYTVEDTITLPSAGSLTNAGKYFTGWTVQGEADLENGGTAVTGWAPGEKSANITLVANWAPVYTITYELGGGAFATTGDHPTTWKAADGEIGTLAEAEKDHYTFVEWRTNPNDHSTAVAALNSTTVTGDLTLYAVYTADEYAVELAGLAGIDTASTTALSGLGFTDSNSYTQNFTVEDALTLPALAKDDYKFMGWSANGGTDIIGTTVSLAAGDITEAKTYTAVFSPTHTVTLTGVSNITNTADFADWDIDGNTASKVFAEADETFALPIPEKAGATCLGWYVSDSATASTSITIAQGTDEDVAYTARWATSVAVSYDYGNGAAPGTANAAFYTINETDSPTTLELYDPTPAAGWEFTGWKAVVAEGNDIALTPESTGTGTKTITIADFADAIVTTEGVQSVTLAAVYEKTPFTITLTGVSGTDNISAVTTAGFTAGSSNYTKTVYVDTASFDLPTLPDDTTNHQAFKGWKEVGSSGDPGVVTIVNTAADASYEPVFAAVPTVTINFTLGTDGEFLAEDLAKLTALGGDATSVTLHADQDADNLAALAIIPAPVKTSGNDIFSGWTVSGDSSGAKVMEYEVPAFSTTSNPTVTLTANWTPVADGETEVLKEGADAGTIGASTATALEGILDVDPGAKAIVKVDVEEADHTGGAVDAAVDGAFAGATGVDTAYLNIDITKYVTTSTQNSEKTEIADLGEVLDIVYDPTGNIPVGKTLDDLGLVVRYHNGQSQTFTKLTAQPASGEEVDGTYWVDSANSLIHIYNRFFSTFALAYTPTLYDVTFDADGGTPVASIRTNKLPSPSAMPTTTKSGYDFNGWFDGNGTQYTGGETVSADLALKAKWTKQATGGGGSGGSGGGGTTPPSPTPTASADPSPTPTGSPEVSPTPTTDPTTEPTTPPAPLAKGKKFKTSNGMTLISNGDGTAKLSKYKGSGKSLTVDTAKDTNGYKYKITSIAAKAAKGNKKLTKLTIGINVAKIGDYAFYGCEHLGWVYVKSLKLTKASRVGKKSFGKTKKKALFKLKKKYFKKTKAAFKKKSGAKKPRYKKV